MPAGDVLRLIAERPLAAGIAVQGARFAGMEIGRRRNAYVVTLFGPAGRSAFAHY
ncbi:MULTISPECIES: hypothetical protein [Nitratireductor]|uniref:hypothetical protein n=1 Tax=Nitratireductor TaxID=245876 RepID=UPI003857E711